MVRCYKKKLGSRNYKNYSQENVENALEKVVDQGWSLRKACKEFKIPFGTLYNRFHGQRVGKNGGQPVFSKNEELSFIKAISTCGEWGFPLTLLDVRQLAKSYLDSQGRAVDKFNNNMPGRDWAYSLLRRYKNEVSHKLAANIKRSRADVSRQVIEDYFQNLTTTLEGVPPSHIFNYDETNLQDDPGQKKMLFRRGTKYPERICNFTKSATSIMMCGSASGVLLPPYIIYKSEKMWLQWTEKGPKGPPCCDERCCAAGSRYNRTHHGWMDAQTFGDWFVSTFLPHAKRLEGRKVLLGDNLSSHFTNDVLRLCAENNISFVCLPRNSTHITQPLDVGFFRPFKIAWRAVLTRWKAANKLSTSIDKKDFPHLLNATLLEMENKIVGGAIKKNLIASFKATGIAPLDPNSVLRKIPSENADDAANQAVNNVLVEYLQQQRFSTTPTRRNIKRQKLVVEPGKSVTAPTEDDSDSNSSAPEPLTNDNSDNEPMEDVQEEVEYFAPKDNEIMKGKFLLVKVLGGSRKKTIYRYVAIVQDVTDEGEIEVLGMKSLDDQRRIFKAVENDEFSIEFPDIIALLPNPELKDFNGQEAYFFNQVVDVNEM